MKRKPVEVSLLRGKFTREAKRAFFRFRVAFDDRRGPICERDQLIKKEVISRGERFDQT